MLFRSVPSHDTAGGVANLTSVVSMASSIGSSVGNIPTPPPAPRNEGGSNNNNNNSNSSTESGGGGAVGEQNQQTASGGESENSGDGGGGGGGGKSKSSSKVSNGALIATGDIVIIRNCDVAFRAQRKTWVWHRCRICCSCRDASAY